MTSRAMAWLREAPAALPALGAVALLVWWAAGQGGYPVTHWAPGGLIVIVLLGIALLASPPQLAQAPAGVKLALACLALYAAFSFCSIVWAGVPADAWEGADRTLLYLLLFALFALWGARGASAAPLLSAWTLAMIVLAVYTALHVRLSTGGGFYALFEEERLSYPTTYVNASPAQWLMAFWPAVLLASGRTVPWALRGVLAGGAVLLADVALLSQSRGSMYATALMVVLVFALVPQRVRLFATAVPIAGAIAATAPLVLRVGERIKAGQSPYASVHAAVAAALLAALATAIVVGLAGAAERRASRSMSPALARGVRRAVAAAGLATLLGAVAAGLLAAGDPVARARSAWDSFKGGYSRSERHQTRLFSGLGSNRYDFYRVSLDELTAHPLGGIGADNFAQQYLAHGRSHETPRYPHSVELRVLAQTGAVGALLALAGLAGALAAAWRAMRRADPLGRTVAAAALAGFGYWAVHGSFDWFWEFAGLGGPAFALLGIACSLTPRAAAGRRPEAPAAPRPSSVTAPEPRSSPVTGSELRPSSVTGSEPSLSVTASGSQPAATKAPGHRRGRAGRARRLGVAALAGVVALGAAYAFAAPWLSESELQSAARIWTRAPLAAYGRLEDAAALDPLSARPYLVAGSIALRFGDTARAERQFSLALRRVPADAYATLELGAIASAGGERPRARALLARAVRLDPKDPLYREALRTASSGRRVNVGALNAAILARARRLA